MSSPAADIGAMLAANGVGTIGTNIFISLMPNTPDAVIALYDSGGFPGESGYKYEYPTIQVRIRGAKGQYISAYAKAEAVRNFLHDRANITWGVNRYIGIWSMSDILFLGQDELNRPELSINFRIHRTY
jgi:hypothetical protein